MARDRNGSTEGSRAAPSGSTRAVSRLMLVDDDDELARAMAASLRRIGVDVTVATTAHDAKDILRSGADFDVVITDVELPGNGGGVLGVLQEVDLQSPVIVLTALGAEAAARRVRHEGIFRILRKPISNASLRRVVRDALDAKTA